MSDAVFTSDQLAAIQKGYEKALPRILNHARIRLRGIRDMDDAVSDVVGIGWVHYLRCVEQGKNPDEFISNIADFAVRQVRVGRHVTSQDAANDVMSARARHRRGFQLQGFPDKIGGGSDENEIIDALADRRQSTPADQAAFRIDVQQWLESLGAKRPIVEDMMRGEDTTDLAERYGKSPGRISQIRQEAHRSWNDMHESRGR